jgi:hypothetical protein
MTSLLYLNNDFAIRKLMGILRNAILNKEKGKERTM